MALYSNFEKEINKGRFILEKKHALDYFEDIELL
jgi:hypothetical protein